MGEETWFNLGDRDLAAHIFRTEQLSLGKRLGEITAAMCDRLGVRQSVIPCTDDRLETYVTTRTGAMHLQEFWVKNRGEPEVEGVEFRGEEGARAARGAIEALEAAERIVFCPANPVTSILPILAVGGLRQAIARSKARKVAVSPIIGGAPVAGPAGKLMRAIGLEPSSLAVSKLYRGLIGCMLVDPADAHHGEAMRDGRGEGGREPHCHEDAAPTKFSSPATSWAPERMISQRSRSASRGALSHALDSILRACFRVLSRKFIVLFLRPNLKYRWTSPAWSISKATFSE